MGVWSARRYRVEGVGMVCGWCVNVIGMMWYVIVLLTQICVKCYENMKRFYLRIHECQMGIIGGYGSCCR